MTPEAQRIAIAEACGWKQTHIMQMGCKGKYVRTYQKGRGKLHQKLPDYINDLNAMHEAEKVMTVMQQALFVAKLSGVLSPSRFPQSFRMLHAAAAQRAEAFLRTLNLWKD